jgi:elongation factor G
MGSETGDELAIYMPLIDEAVQVWRPVSARRIATDIFEVVDSVPEDEVWQFQPGAIVQVKPKRFASGGEGLVAVRLAWSSAPQPLIEIAIEPKSKADQEKLYVALSKLAAEDPSFSVSVDLESGQTIIKGMDELRLDIKVDILRHTYKVDANIGLPQVAYREKLMRRIEIDETHKKQSAGSGQFARVKMVFEPNEAGKGSAFESQIVGGTVPTEYVAGVEKGFNSVLGSGVLAGFPVVDVKATLVDGAYHDIDSSVLAFEIAGRAAFRRALREGGSALLEPVMKVEVTTPEYCTGSVTGDLLGRRGRVQGQDMRGDAVVINAMVPLANMFGYVDALRSFTGGQAAYVMEFEAYQPVPLPPDRRPPPAAAAMRA